MCLYCDNSYTSCEFHFQISSESETTRRYIHSAGVVRSSPHLVEVLLFGGYRGGLIAETRVLEFGKCGVFGKGNV